MTALKTQLLFNDSHCPLQDAFFSFYEDDSLFSPCFQVSEVSGQLAKEEIQTRYVALSPCGRERLRFEAAKQQRSPRRQWLINKSVGAGSEGCKVGSKLGVAAGTCSLQE